MACSWYNPVSYGDCAGQVAKSVAGDAFDRSPRSFGHAAAGRHRPGCGSSSNAATAVHLGGAGFATVLGIVAAIAGDRGGRAVRHSSSSSRCCDANLEAWAGR